LTHGQCQHRHADAGRHPRLSLLRRAKSRMPTCVGMTGTVAPMSQSFGRLVLVSVREQVLQVVAPQFPCHGRPAPAMTRKLRSAGGRFGCSRTATYRTAPTPRPRMRPRNFSSAAHEPKVCHLATVKRPFIAQADRRSRQAGRSAIHPTQPFAAATMNDRFGGTAPLA
jgi:hypothetical protein